MTYALLFCRDIRFLRLLSTSCLASSMMDMVFSIDLETGTMESLGVVIGEPKPLQETAL